MTGTLSFVIIPSTETIQPQSKRVSDIILHVRALFDYEPDDDPYIPCRELGLPFRKGDILHVINQDDLNWWQAYREGEEDQRLAGLIPSKHFQQQRAAVTQNREGRSHSGSRDYNGHDNMLIFQEVTLYYPQTHLRRPVVLIGPPSVGRHELRQKLMESDIQRFAAAVPHTTRPKKSTEVDGEDYHFVSRHAFERAILSRKFVEHGEFERNYYGTSLEAIRKVMNSGKTCVLNLHPQSLRLLCNSDLKPYVVFIASPNIDLLREMNAATGQHLNDDTLRHIIQKSHEIERSYAQYFDATLVNNDMSQAYEDLLQIINSLETDPQWIPASWVT